MASGRSSTAPLMALAGGRLGAAPYSRGGGWCVGSVCADSGGCVAARLHPRVLCAAGWGVRRCVCVGIDVWCCCTYPTSRPFLRAVRPTRVPTPHPRVVRSSRLRCTSVRATTQDGGRRLPYGRLRWDGRDRRWWRRWWECRGGRWRREEGRTRVANQAPCGTADAAAARPLQELHQPAQRRCTRAQLQQRERRQRRWQWQWRWLRQGWEASAVHVCR